MNDGAEQLVRMRPEILALQPYRQGRAAPEDAYKLSSNENPFEPIPEVLAAIAAASVNRYPDATSAGLRLRLAERHGVHHDRVHVGAGSVAILAQLIAAAAGPGDEVLYAWRSFEAYPGLVVVAGASSVRVPLAADGSHDLRAMAAAVGDRTRLVLVCSPNNPTGTVVSAIDFVEFMASIPSSVLVVLDEAYAEFVTDPAAVDGTRLLDRYANLVVLRTFSKAYGLAGLRIGYAIGAEYVLDAARAAAIPLSVIAHAQLAALAALDNERVLLGRVQTLAELRDRVWTAMLDQGWTIPVPQGNFVWLATGEFTELAVEVFARRGIVVRAFGGEGIRVSIAEEETVDDLLLASAEVVGMLQATDSDARLD